MYLRRYAFLAVCSFAAITIFSCTIPFSHTREEIPEFIEKTCKRENGLIVHAWVRNDTLWVYSSDVPKGALSPLGVAHWMKQKEKETLKMFAYVIRELDLIKDRHEVEYRINAYPRTSELPPLEMWVRDQFIEEKIQIFMRAIFNVVWRANLTLEDPFKFNVVIVGAPDSDYNQYYVSFFPDTLKLNMRQISSTQNRERTLQFSYPHPYARDDASGSYITPYDISGNEFVSTLLQSRIIDGINDERIIIKESEFEPDKDVLREILAIASEKANSLMPIYTEIHGFRTVVLSDVFSQKMQTLEFAAAGEPVSPIPKTKETISKMFTIQFYYKLASIKLNQGRYDDVKWYLDKIFSLDPDYPFAHVLNAQAQGKSGEWQTAKSIYKEVLDKHPRFLPALQGLAEANYALGRYGDALEAFEIIIKQKPRWWQPYYGRGTVYHAMGKYDWAIESYQEALDVLEETVSEARKEFFTLIDEDKVNEDRAAVKNAIGEAYLAMKAYALAANYLDQAVSLYKNNAGAYVNLGLVSQEQGNYQKAVEYYQKALNVEPTSLLAYRQLGRSYAQLGQYEKAREFYHKALGLSDSNSLSSSIHVDIGLSYADESRYDEAIKSYQTALQLDPAGYNAHLMSGFAYLNLKEYDKAIISFQSAIELNDQFADAYRGLGISYFYSEQYEEAKIHFQKARELFLKQNNPKAVNEIQSYLINIP